MERQNPDYDEQQNQQNLEQQQSLEQRQQILQQRENVERVLQNLEQQNLELRQQILQQRENIERVRQNLEQLQQVLMGHLPQAELNNGLTAHRIGRFQHFTAGESLVGEQCIVCMNDLEVGRQMVRLDCHVSHYLCKVCADTWFKDQKTCPFCRHIFK